MELFTATRVSAAIDKFGALYWYRDGDYHRIDGPAWSSVDIEQGRKNNGGYWIYGKYLTKNEWEKLFK